MWQSSLRDVSCLQNKTDTKYFMFDRGQINYSWCVRGEGVVKNAVTLTVIYYFSLFDIKISILNIYFYMVISCEILGVWNSYFNLGLITNASLKYLSWTLI